MCMCCMHNCTMYINISSKIVDFNIYIYVCLYELSHFHKFLFFGLVCRRSYIEALTHTYTLYIYIRRIGKKNKYSKRWVVRLIYFWVGLLKNCGAHGTDFLSSFFFHLICLVLFRLTLSWLNQRRRTKKKKIKKWFNDFRVGEFFF